MRSLPILAIALVLISMCSFSCDKEEKEPELPPITQSGANTFGCLVNGEVWLPKKGMITIPPVGASNNQNIDKRWKIEGVNEHGTFLLKICKESVQDGIISSFNEGECSSAKYIDRSDNESIHYKTVGEIYSGEVEIIRFDTDKEIISGTFWFDAVNDAGETVEIRDGRFDLKFTNYQP